MRSTSSFFSCFLGLPFVVKEVLVVPMARPYSATVKGFDPVPDAIDPNRGKAPFGGLSELTLTLNVFVVPPIMEFLVLDVCMRVGCKFMLLIGPLLGLLS